MLILSLLDLRQNQSPETVPICIAVLYFHITILFEFTCVINVRDQTCLAFVTCSGPFGDSTSKFVHRPQNVWSTNVCQVQAYLDNL